MDENEGLIEESQKISINYSKCAEDHLDSEGWNICNETKREISTDNLMCAEDHINSEGWNICNETTWVIGQVSEPTRKNI